PAAAIERGLVDADWRAGVVISARRSLGQVLPPRTDRARPPPGGSALEGRSVDDDLVAEFDGGRFIIRRTPAAAARGRRCANRGSAPRLLRREGGGAQQRGELAACAGRSCRGGRGFT